jgi:hypothetical protein
LSKKCKQSEKAVCTTKRRLNWHTILIGLKEADLPKKQTRYIFETRTIGFKDEETAPVDDIIETSNHFVAFDFLPNSLGQPLTDSIINEFHRILKTGASDAQKTWFAVGDWKKLVNEVGNTQTVLPQNVESEINQLNN